MEPTSDTSAAPLEQALTEALLALSWPLPRTVHDADAALTRLEAVKAVLSELEQQSVGTEAWWAGQVDGLATQSGFVLEWWRPVLRDPDLDWTLNHQAHLTADLATLASAGARLLDQIEPRAAEEAADAAHARRVLQDKRWGPAAVPPLVAGAGPKPGTPGSRPQPPAQVFGAAAAAAEVHAPPATSPQPGTVPGLRDDPNAPQFPQRPSPADAVAGAPESHAAPLASAARAAAAAGAFDPDAPPVAAPPSIPAQQASATSAAQAADRPPVPPGSIPAAAAPTAQAAGRPSVPAESIPASAASAAPSSLATDPASAAARHRRPAYDFDDPRGSAPPAAVYPQAGLPPRSPVVPGPGFGGPPQQGRTLAPGGTYAPAERGPGPFGFTGEDEDDPDSLVPAGLRRHQRRLLLQTGAILGAIGVLCWWAVYTLSSPSPHATAASGESTHATATSTDRTAAGGLTTPGASASATSKATESVSPPAAPSTATSSVPDTTTVSSVRVTLLGGSSTVPQIVALISVDTGSTGQVTVTGSYYGASGTHEVAAETERWTLSGQTSYQYSVPIANSAYCGTEFHFTVSAGGRSEAEVTEPGC